MSSPTLEAVIILQKVLRERHSLRDYPIQYPLAQELIYGTLRYLGRLENILNQLLKNPLSQRDQDVHALLLTGLYQLLYLKQPEYAVVNETVHSATTLGKPWAKKLINAILRNFLRQKADCLAKADQDIVGRFAHPRWLIQKIRDAWSTQWENILTANNQYPPFTLRVNLLKAQRDDYLPGEYHPYNLCGITLPQAKKAKDLSGFAEGKVSIQDGAAQLAANLLDLQSRQRVLDACAAPGNKTAHLLETQPDIDLTAIDIQRPRLKTIEEQLKRLDLHATLLLADASDPKSWWDNQLFDRILIDAPCSASGVIRRHPDIKYMRRPSDISTLVQQQHQLLSALWPLLKPGGLLLYVTCSIFPEENTHVIADFLKHHTDAEETVLNVPWGIAQPHGRQILPGMDNMDGFYYVLLRKNTKI